jgi:DNA-binding MarR family transcriptional regulator
MSVAVGPARVSTAGPRTQESTSTRAYTLSWMSEPRWLNDAEMRLFRAFLAASSGVTSRLDTLLKTTNNISLDDYEVLVHLSEAPEQRVRMSELSDLLLHSRSRLSQRVDRLVERGLVEREKCDSDARGTWAVLTTEGVAMLRVAATDHVEHVRQHLFDHLDPNDIPVLTKVLEELAAASRSS